VTATFQVIFQEISLKFPAKRHPPSGIIKKRPPGASPITGIISPTTSSESPTSPTSRSGPSGKSNPFRDYLAKIGTFPVKLIKKSNWKLSDEVSYLYITKDSNGKPLLYIGQAGNNYATVNFEGKLQKHFQDEKSSLNLISERKGPVSNTGK
jgi:hypothetical protein